MPVLSNEGCSLDAIFNDDKYVNHVKNRGYNPDWPFKNLNLKSLVYTKTAKLCCYFFSSKSISERFKAQIRESKKSGESEISFFTRAFRCVLSDLAWPWLEMMRGKAVFQSLLPLQNREIHFKWWLTGGSDLSLFLRIWVRFIRAGRWSLTSL